MVQKCYIAPYGPSPKNPSEVDDRGGVEVECSLKELPVATERSLVADTPGDSRRRDGRQMAYMPNELKRSVDVMMIWLEWSMGRDGVIYRTTREAT